MIETTRLLKRAQYRNHLAAERALAEVGTTLAQWNALHTILELPGAAAHALALASFQSDQAFGTLATRLEAQGLIARAPGKGRAIEHRLTAAGKKIHAVGTKIVGQVSARSLAALTKAEVAQLHALLERLVE